MSRLWLIWGVCVVFGSACECSSGGDGSDPRANGNDGSDEANVDRDGSDGDDPGECGCPELPPTCVEPDLDTPAFSPSSGTYQSLLANTIACAKASLEVAAYHTEWDCVVDLFVEQLAREPELTLDLVIDDGMCPMNNEGDLLCAWSKLAEHPRVTIVGDERTVYMHHKFVIADDERVWTGSANFTEISFCADHNNAIVIEEPSILAAYDTAFSRMFVDHEFGPVVEPETASGGAYRVFMGPKSPVMTTPPWLAEMLTAIEGAESSLDFMIFAFTRTDVSDALIAAHERGVTVRGLIAPEYSTMSPANQLRAAGIDLRVASVHHKTLLVDGEIVITGTPNWSAKSLENNEASLWIEDPGAYAAYAAELDAIWAATTP